MSEDSSLYVKVTNNDKKEISPCEKVALLGQAINAGRSFSYQNMQYLSDQKGLNIEACSERYILFSIGHAVDLQ